MKRRDRDKNLSSSLQSKVMIADLRGRSQSKGFKSRDKSKGRLNKYEMVECHYCEKKGTLRSFVSKLRRIKKRIKETW